MTALLLHVARTGPMDKTTRVRKKCPTDQSCRNFESPEWYPVLLMRLRDFGVCSEISEDDERRQARALCVEFLIPLF
jgi:hypothetical protein